MHDDLYSVIHPEGTDLYPDGAHIEKSNFHWIFNRPYNGPGKAFVELLSSSSEPVQTPQQICYPEGAINYISFTSRLVPQKKDIHPDIKTALINNDINSGFSISEMQTRNLENANLSYSQFIIPRYHVKGNIKSEHILRDIKTLIGY